MDTQSFLQERQTTVERNSRRRRHQPLSLIRSWRSRSACCSREGLSRWRWSIAVSVGGHLLTRTFRWGPYFLIRLRIFNHYWLDCHPSPAFLAERGRLVPHSWGLATCIPDARYLI